MVMRLLTSDEVPAFVAAKRAAALHFDADWDAKYREQVRQSMLDAQAALDQEANFAEIDCDSNVELSKSIPVLNVPLVAYYRDGKVVAALIGADQNVRARVERVLRGERIGYKDGTSAA
jgi:thioredoxin-like negative regulator of GroEL